MLLSPYSILFEVFLSKYISYLGIVFRWPEQGISSKHFFAQLLLSCLKKSMSI